MEAEQFLVMAKIDEEIARIRTSIGYVKQGLNRAYDDRETRRNQALLRQRTTELAYWLDIKEFATNNVLPSETACEQVRSDTDLSTRTPRQPVKARPAFTDSPERRLAHSAGLLKADRETAAQHD